MLIFNTFSFCLPSPKAGDDNLMQEVNQNLAEEVRIVDFQKCILNFGWYIRLLSVTNSPCVLVAGWSEHQPHLPACGERGRWGKTAGHVTLNFVFFPLSPSRPLSISCCGRNWPSLFSGLNFWREEFTFPTSVDTLWSFPYHVSFFFKVELIYNVVLVSGV